jgi:hypothetical protein
LIDFPREPPSWHFIAESPEESCRGNFFAPALAGGAAQSLLLAQLSVGKVKFRDSEPDEMIQIVDMVLGAVGADLDGDSTWFRLIRGRSAGVIRIP